MAKIKLYVIENHNQLYDIWKRENVKGLDVAHLDFHCDMRGIMVNRKKQIAYRVPDVRKGVDMGNFLAHSILEGMVGSVKWIFDTPGGRKYDVHTIKYSTDVTSTQYNLFAKMGLIRSFPFQYEAVEFSKWRGAERTEFLDIDWDVFAALEIKADELTNRVERFFDKTHDKGLSGISVCYSPSHSHPTRTEFESFVDRVAAMCDAEIEVVEEVQSPDSNRPLVRDLIPKGLYRPAQQTYYTTRLTMKKLGIY